MKDLNQRLNVISEGDMEWIKCSDRMPLEISIETGFRCLDVLVTDGETVGTCACEAGKLPEPWVAFSPYGDINKDIITHWMPLPEPPSE